MQPCDTDKRKYAALHLSKFPNFNFLCNIYMLMLIPSFSHFIYYSLQTLDNTYHIPICIWLMDTHPYNAPLAYVRPTSDMQIKVSMYVDYNGKIYLPYLHDWNPVSVTFCFHPSTKTNFNCPTPINRSQMVISSGLYAYFYSHNRSYWVLFK